MCEHRVPIEQSQARDSRVVHGKNITRKLVYTDFQDACLAVGRCRVRHHNNSTSEIVMWAGRATQATKCFLCRNVWWKLLVLKDRRKLNMGTIWWLSCCWSHLVIPVENIARKVRTSSEHTSSQLMAKCMCDAGPVVWSKKKSRPGRRAVPLGGPLGLDRSRRFCGNSEENLSSRKSNCRGFGTT